MIPDKESQNVEFKQGWHDDYLKWVCGFANAGGGSLFVGVNDEGKVCGLNNSRQLMEEIPSKTRDLMGVTVAVNLLNEKGKDCIEIITPEYNTPISLRGRYYYRSGSTNAELTGNALTDFLMRKFGKTWDDVYEISYSPELIDTKTIEIFKRLALDRLPGVSAENDPQILLQKLNLIKNGKLNRAAILLFGADPQDFFKQAHIRIGKFASDVDIISSDLIVGNLFQQVDQALNILKAKYLTSAITYEGIHRREILEYPYLALREAILNAIIHRDYLTTSATQIRIFTDKLIIINEGALPHEIKVEDLKVTHLSKPEYAACRCILQSRLY